MASASRRRIDIIILLIVLVGGYFAVRNAVAIVDWWHAVRYQPPTAVARAANDAGLSDTGRRLFYRFSPQFLDSDDIGTRCGGHRLGCVEGQTIYLLASTTQAERYRSAVTAAHETLHVAYSRLSEDDRSKVRTMLDEQLAKYPDRTIDEQLAGLTSDDYHNEAHSYVGTQQAEMLPELATYYDAYFDDRQAVLDAYEASPEGR